MMTSIMIEIKQSNHLIIILYCCWWRSAIGAAYGTAKSGVGIAGIGTFRPDLVMKALIPVVMAGIIAIYGLVVSVLISGSSKASSFIFLLFILLLPLLLTVSLPPLNSGRAWAAILSRKVRLPSFFVRSHLLNVWLNDCFLLLDPEQQRLCAHGLWFECGICRNCSWIGHWNCGWCLCSWLRAGAQGSLLSCSRFLSLSIDTFLRLLMQLFVGMVLILIFAEVLGLYGLIVALILNTKFNNDICQLWVGESLKRKKDRTKKSQAFFISVLFLKFEVVWFLAASAAFWLGFWLLPLLRLLRRMFRHHVTHIFRWLISLNKNQGTQFSWSA